MLSVVDGCELGLAKFVWWCFCAKVIVGYFLHENSNLEAKTIYEGSSEVIWDGRLR